MSSFTLTNHNKKIQKIQIHNDRQFESETKHIDADLSEKNLYWCWCGRNTTFAEAEKLFYKLNYKKSISKTNNGYARRRQFDRIKTYEDKLTSSRTAPTEMIFQIGSANDGTIPKTVLIKIFNEWAARMKRAFGKNWHMLYTNAKDMTSNYINKSNSYVMFYFEKNTSKDLDLIKEDINYLKSFAGNFKEIEISFNADELNKDGFYKSYKIYDISSNFSDEEILDILNNCK